MLILFFVSMTNKLKEKRKLDLVVLSDIHLGTYGCHAKELLNYLNSIKPKKIILNGDIIDIWQFKKRYFPKSHLKVVKKLMTMAANGVEVIYITGNHDELLRKFSKTTIGNISIVDKYITDLNGKKAWFFHGDVFDVSIQNAKWLAKLGSWDYDLLILINRLINWFLIKSGKEKFSLSKKIKNSVKGAVKYINDFEKTAIDLAIENNFDYVVCGHIHQPTLNRVQTEKGITTYLNSGDWVENLTALEYQFKRWRIFNYNEDKLQPFILNDDEQGEESLAEFVATITF